MHNTEIGVLLLGLAGLMNASFALPMKYTRRWAWENTWLVWTIFALFLLPAALTLYAIPNVVTVYLAPGFVPLLLVMGFGLGWGLSQVFFGIAVEAIGIALTFSLVLGTSAAMGALLPMLRLNPEKLHTSAGHILLLGVATILLGVGACAAAGRMRERISLASGAHRGTKAGLALAILCGCGASLMNVGVAFGAPLIAAASVHGADAVSASNVVWLPLLVAGGVPNVLYCFYLMKRNSTGRRLLQAGLGHWALALMMAIFWYGSVILYGASISRLGPLGAAVGWPLFMSLIVVTASLIGMLAGEWKGSGLRSLALQLAGVAVLVLAIFILAAASRSLA